MRLLHFDESGRPVLTDFAGKTIPRYAILSHRWWGDADEVHYHDILNNTYASKDGYRKLEFCAEQASQDHLQYFWIDTCCFDRYNNLERSNAVNSMFKWYQNAEKCYAFLSDVSVATVADAQQQNAWEARFRASKWFTRAWTLQELIAPTSVEFFSSEGLRLGDKNSLLPLLEGETGIPSEVLQADQSGAKLLDFLEKFSVSDRMSWARTREATEPEDHAYCLLGILNVQIPLAYGEGKEEALRRLLDEVEQSDTTPSIIPFSRNKRFVGRQSQLKEVENILSTRKETTRIAITGEGGTGKSQLALEIAYRVKERDKACSVFWIDASDIGSVYQAYTSITQKLKLPGWEDEKADVLQLVKRHVGQNYAKRWLLIFDNVDGVKLADAGVLTTQPVDLINILPQSGFGSVIFTTTHSDIVERLAVQNMMELQKMEPNTAHEMFMNYLTISVPTNETQDITRLLENLSYLPLAIAQAAAYLNQNKTMKIKDYLSLLNAQEIEAFQLNSTLFQNKSPSHVIPSSIIMTLLTSLDQIRDSHSLATHFLCLIACVDRKDILLDYLTPWSQEREDAIKLLSDYALVTRRPAVSAVDLHRLVHLAVQRWIEKYESIDKWTERAVRHLAEVFPDHNHGNRSKWRRLLPHAGYVLSRSPTDVDNDARISLVWKCAMSLHEDGQHNEAAELFVQVMETRKKKLGADHPSTLTSMANLASTFWNQGRWEAAEELFMQVMETSKKKLGADHPDTLTSMANLASTYRNQGRWEAAEELEVQVMETRKKKLGADHPSTLTSMNNLAFTWKGQGRDADALQLMSQCLELRIKVIGGSHPHTLSSLMALLQWSGVSLDSLSAIERHASAASDE